MKKLNNEKEEDLKNVKNCKFRPLQRVLSIGFALVIPFSSVAHASTGPYREFDNKYFEIFRQLLHKAIERDNEKNKQELGFKGFNLVASTLPYKMDEIIKLHDNNFDLDILFKTGLIKGIKVIDSGKVLSYDEVLDYAKNNGVQSLINNNIIIYGGNSSWDGAILYYDYDTDKFRVLPVRLNISNKVQDYSDQTAPFDLEKGMAYWRNPWYQPVKAIKREYLDASEKTYIDFEELMEIYHDKGYDGLKDIVLLVDGVEYNLVDVIVGVVGDRIYVQISPFDYDKLCAQMESGEYFNAKDGFERCFMAYSMENGDWVRINHRGLYDLYKKYGDDVANEVEIRYPLQSEWDEYSVIDTPFEIAGVKETEDGFMISIEKSDPVKLAKKYAEKGFSFRMLDGMRSGIITVAHHDEGFLTVDEFAEMVDEAYRLDWENSTCVNIDQLLKKLDIYDGNAETPIAGVIYDIDWEVSFSPDKPIKNYDLDNEYQKSIKD